MGGGASNVLSRTSRMMPWTIHKAMIFTLSAQHSSTATSGSVGACSTSNARACFALLLSFFVLPSSKNSPLFEKEVLSISLSSGYLALMQTSARLFTCPFFNVAKAKQDIKENQWAIRTRKSRMRSFISGLHFFALKKPLRAMNASPHFESMSCTSLIPSIQRFKAKLVLTARRRPMTTPSVLMEKGSARILPPGKSSANLSVTSSSRMITRNTPKRKLIIPIGIH
mmetsp:Transcript_2090/g.3814  ORF Transcript_2090/g.3814 Transcript_2090/m.3814 type:complete len:226 (-) Transcript_2090:162-839(-)